jgi:NAD(P)-dependent dehydrogenase (short-subunit alcohol dehydrogenase family)
MKTNPSANKAALVTGGSRGIGAAIVRRLAKDGASVAFTYSNAKEKAAAMVAELESHGGKALAIHADSANAEAVQAAVTQTVEAFGRLDILVNNAGILLRGGIDTFSLEDFDRMIAVNVRPVFVGAQAAGRHMSDGGRIIVIGSVTAERRFSRVKRLFNDQGCGSRSGKRFGDRLRTSRNPRQHDPARTDRNRYESGGWSTWRGHQKSRAAQTAGARR